MKKLKNNIFGPYSMILFVFAIVTFFAIKTKDTVMIVTSIILGILFILFILDELQKSKKSKVKKIRFDINYVLLIILLIISVMFGASLTLLIRNISLKRNGVETKAIIYNVEEKINYKTEYDDDNAYKKKEESCYFYIKYYAQNKEYTKKLNEQSCHYSVGDEIKIYYERGTPDNFVEDLIGLLSFSTLLAGTGLIIVLVKCGRAYLEKNHKKKNLI